MEWRKVIEKYFRQQKDLILFDFTLSLCVADAFFQVLTRSDGSYLITKSKFKVSSIFFLFWHFTFGRGNAIMFTYMLYVYAEFF